MLVVVERRVARAGPSGFLVVTFHGAVRVPVVLDHRQPRLAGRPDGLLHLLDLLVAAWPSVDTVGEAADHHDVHAQAGGLVTFHLGPEVRFLPGRLPSSSHHIADAELLHPAEAGLAQGARQADLRRVGTLHNRPRPLRRGHRRGRHGRRAHSLHHSSAGQIRIHARTSSYSEHVYSTRNSACQFARAGWGRPPVGCRRRLAVDPCAMSGGGKRAFAVGLKFQRTGSWESRKPNPG